MKLDYAAIGKRIRALRKDKKMTQADFGKLLNLSVSYIGHVERGSRKASVETIYRIADVLSASLDVLITGGAYANKPASIDPKQLQMLDAIFHVLYAHSDEWR